MPKAYDNESMSFDRFALGDFTSCDVHDAIKIIDAQRIVIILDLFIVNKNLLGFRYKKNVQR
jgi:hypothetical protein